MTLTFWRPQREASPDEPGRWIDVGHSVYIADSRAPLEDPSSFQGGSCPASAYSETDPKLTPAQAPNFPLFYEEPVSGLEDSTDDQRRQTRRTRSPLLQPQPVLRHLPRRTTLDHGALPSSAAGQPAPRPARQRQGNRGVVQAGLSAHSDETPSRGAPMSSSRRESPSSANSRISCVSVPERPPRDPRAKSTTRRPMAGARRASRGSSSGGLPARPRAETRRRNRCGGSRRGGSSSTPRRSRAEALAFQVLRDEPKRGQAQGALQDQVVDRHEADLCRDITRRVQ